MVLGGGAVKSVAPSSVLPPWASSSSSSGDSSCRFGASMPTRLWSRMFRSSSSSSGPPAGPSRSRRTVWRSSSRIFVAESGVKTVVIGFTGGRGNANNPTVYGILILDFRSALILHILSASYFQS